MNFNNVTMMKYLSNSLSSALLLYLYNIFVEGIEYSNIINLYDSSIMVGSVVSSKLIKDLIFDLLKIDNPQGLQYSIVDIVSNVFIYSYLYEFVLKNNFPNTAERSNNINMLIAGVISGVNSYLENPLLSIVSGVKSY